MTNDVQALTRTAQSDWETPLSKLPDDERAAVEAMVRSTMAAGVHADDTPIPLIYHAATIAQLMGLRADLGHVAIYSTRKRVRRDGREQWQTQYQPYVNAEGWAGWCEGFDDDFEGFELVVLTPEQRAERLIKAPLAIMCRIWRRGWRAPVERIGTADPDAPHGSRYEGGKWVGGNAVERVKPHVMAEARAFRGTARFAFPVNAKNLAKMGRLVEGESLRALESTMREEVMVEAQGPRGLTDEWKDFWDSVGRSLDLRDLSKHEIHELAEQRLGVDLTFEEDDGVVTKSFLALPDGVTPLQVWTAIGDQALQAADPSADVTTKERLFGAGGEPLREAERVKERLAKADAASETTAAVDAAEKEVSDAQQTAVEPQPDAGSEEPPHPADAADAGAAEAAGPAEASPSGPSNEGAQPATDEPPTRTEKQQQTFDMLCDTIEAEKSISALSSLEHQAREHVPVGNLAPGDDERLAERIEKRKDAIRQSR